MLLITPRFGLFEAAGWVNEVLSRTEEKNQELPGPYAACCGAVELKDHVRAVIQGLRRVGFSEHVSEDKNKVSVLSVHRVIVST